MTIKQLKKELSLSNKDLAELFEMKRSAFQNSTAKKRYESALCKFYEIVKVKLKSDTN